MKAPRGAPSVGRVYRHYRGELYVVEAVARSAEDPKAWMVVYRALHDPEMVMWCRTLVQWRQRVELDGIMVARFGETVLHCAPRVVPGLANPAAHG